MPSAQGTIHDSVEDARTALLLYRKYQQMQADGTFVATMVDAYTAYRKQKAVAAKKTRG